ncbi:5-hydroxytryptamine receptor 3A-like [Bufo gargarizans]|uniref:5-hydroxytryptamine receptor 3A-like n=1 Tax=Bufo gargarizans TaxID=30331 RepID=UPI001CF4F5C5|nr:5-hydroxytryptamine receptor 3A-like [Bufo gargarizans]
MLEFPPRTFVGCCTANKRTAHENSSTLKASHARLIDHLMHGYNKGVRPVQDWRKATDVYVDLFIYAILAVEEKEQLITTYIWYHQSWFDEFLTWDPEEFDNVTKISVPVSWIWVPDIMVMELVDAGKLPEDSYVYIDSTGKVYNNKPFQIQSTCTFDIYYFPFDRQNCSITFTSWTHTRLNIH